MVISRDKLSYILHRIPLMKKEIADPTRHERIYTFLSKCKALPKDELVESIEKALAHEDERVVSLGIKMIGLLFREFGDHKLIHFILPFESDLLFSGCLEALRLIKILNNELLDRASSSTNLFIIKGTKLWFEELFSLNSVTVAQDLMERILELLKGDSDSQHRGLYYLPDLRILEKYVEADQIYQFCLSTDRNVQSRAVELCLLYSKSGFVPTWIKDIPRVLEEACNVFYTNCNGLCKFLDLIQVFIDDGLWRHLVHDIVSFCLLNQRVDYQVLEVSWKPMSVFFMKTLVNYLQRSTQLGEGKVHLFKIFKREPTSRKEYQYVVQLLQACKCRDEKAVATLSLRFLSIPTKYIATTEKSILFDLAKEFHWDETYNMLVHMIKSQSNDDCELGLQKMCEIIPNGDVVWLENLEKEGIVERARTLATSGDQILRLASLRFLQCFGHLNVWEWIEREQNGRVLLELTKILKGKLIPIHLFNKLCLCEDFEVRLEMVKLMGEIVCNPEQSRDYGILERLLNLAKEDTSASVKAACINILHEILNSQFFANDSHLYVEDVCAIVEGNYYSEPDWCDQDILEMTDSVILEKDPLNEGNNVLFCYDC